MNTFKKKSLYAAVASIGTLGFAGAVQAVNVNSDGLGQVLIYPYYTTQSVGTAPSTAAYNSLLSVVNSTASAKAVKVRFIEGKNSREVLDFNLFLSMNDVWTAAIIQFGAGAGVYTLDHSCTVPLVSSSATAPTPFVNFAYAGDGGGDGLDRTKEGYVEIIEMGVVTGTTAAGVTHTGGTGKDDGAPACKAIDDATATSNTTNPTGGLFGGISLINVLAGVDVSENAVALDNFRTTGKYDLPGDIKPDLRDVNPPTAVLFNGNAGVVSATGFAQNVDAVSALFMVNHVYNEFVLDATTASRTDWVLTMPTKRYYFTSGAVNYLFQRNFTTNSCDDVGLTLYDREEYTKTTPQGFSPPPPPGKVAGLCYEANVLTFNNPSLLGSVNTLTATTTFPNGWGDLVIPAVSKFDGAFAHFLPANAITTISLTGVSTTAAGSFVGLPIIGFQAQSFTNGALNNNGTLVQANYAAGFNHRFTRLIQ
jgi:hypothetical protein